MCQGEQPHTCPFTCLVLNTLSKKLIIQLVCIPHPPAYHLLFVTHISITILDAPVISYIDVHHTVTRKYYVGLVFLCLTGFPSHYNFRAQIPSHRVNFLLGKYQTQVLLLAQPINDTFPPLHSRFESGRFNWRAFVLPLRHQFPSRLIRIIEFG